MRLTMGWCTLPSRGQPQNAQSGHRTSLTATMPSAPRASHSSREWLIAAPFLHDPADVWLGAFVPNADGALRFRTIPAPYGHDGSRALTGWRAWRDYFGHARDAWHQLGNQATTGLLTSFPHLAITFGLRKRLSRSRMPLVAWTFNLGGLHSGFKRLVARAALGAVDRFIVHSRAEATSYSRWLGLPAERFLFVPLQCPTRLVEFEEDRADPFILSMGSAKRDYRLLFQALAKLGHRAVIVAATHAVAGLPVPPGVEIRSGLSEAQCFELIQRARLCVVPVANRETASGQVTLLNAMMYGRPVVVTQCVGSVDYVIDGVDALLVRPGDLQHLEQAIEMCWHDEALRLRLGAAARVSAIANFSDEAVGQIMGRVLRELNDSR